MKKCLMLSILIVAAVIAFPCEKEAQAVSTLQGDTITSTFTMPDVYSTTNRWFGASGSSPLAQVVQASSYYTTLFPVWFGVGSTFMNDELHVEAGGIAGFGPQTSVFDYYDLDWTDNGVPVAITGVNVLQNDFPGITYSFTGNSFHLEIQNIASTPPGFAVPYVAYFRFITAPLAPAPVPEPGTLALLAAGFLPLAYAAKRRRTKQE